MTFARFALAATLGTLAACGAPSSEPTQHLPLTATPNLTLYVSNQSFDKEIVDIRVRIDGELAVSGDFDVEGQHSWHEFGFALADGAHAIEVTSRDSTARLEAPFTLAGHTYAVVDFWYVAGDVEQPEHFSWFTSDEPITFE